MDTILPILPAFLLVFGALSLHILRRVKPGYPHLGNVAMVISFFSWLLLLGAGFVLPKVIVLLPSDLQEMSSLPIVLITDKLSWAVAISLTTILLGVLLTAPVRAIQVGYGAWVSNLMQVGIGIVAIFSANPLTLIVTWAALDILELVALFGYIQSSESRRRIVFVFSVRTLSIFLLAWVSVLESSLGIDLSFLSFVPGMSFYLLVFAGIRLGLLAFRSPYLHDMPQRHGLDTCLQASPIAASLVLLARIAENGIEGTWAFVLLIGSTIFAVIGSVLWTTSANDLSGRPFWILGTASLAFASAVAGQQAACLAWGLALLLPGSMVFLASMRQRVWFWLVLGGVIVLCGVPFTPMWAAGGLYSATSFILWLPYLFAQGLLLAGFVRHSVSERPIVEAIILLKRLTYLMGLGLFPLAYLLIGWYLGLNTAVAPWWPGISALGLVMILFFASRQKSFKWLNLSLPVGRTVRALFTFDWILFIVLRTFHFVEHIYRASMRILEGEAGILWALLLLILFVSVSAALFR